MRVDQTAGVLLTCGVGGGAVLSRVVDQLQLGELEWLHHQRDALWGIPLEYQVVCSVGH